MGNHNKAKAATQTLPTW